MPHCIIEYSTNLSAPELIEAVYQGAKASGLFSDDDIKTRALGFDDYQSGSVGSAFVHVAIKILSGRTQGQRSQLSALVLSQLKSLNLGALSLTVEVLEIERESYAKAVS